MIKKYIIEAIWLAIAVTFAYKTLWLSALVCIVIIELHHIRYTLEKSNGN